MYDPYMGGHPLEGVKKEPLDPTIDLIATQAYQLGRSQEESMRLNTELRELKSKLEEERRERYNAEYNRDRYLKQRDEYAEDNEKLNRAIAKLKPKKKTAKKGKK